MPAVEVAQLIVDVRVEGNFDVTDDQVLRWLTRRHRRLCARSRCFRKMASIGTTVTDQVAYAIPANVVEVKEVQVDGAIYGKMTHSNISAGRQGFLVLSGDGGVMAGTEDADGLEQIALFPTPDTDGKDIVVRGAFLPPDLDVTDDTTIKIPYDYMDDLVAGAIATGLARTEQRPDLAAPYETQFNGACEELRRYVNRKYRGTGPSQIKVQGYDA